MKKITNQTILFIIFFILTSFHSFAQTSITQNDVWASLSNADMGQSFTATQDGVLTNIQVVPNITGNSILRIYSGAGIGGTLLHTQSVVFTDLYNDPSDYSFQTIVIDYPLNISNGSIYTFSFSGTNSFVISIFDSYAGGNLYLTNSSSSSFDFTFRILQGSGNTAPTATSVTFTGTVKVGEQLTGSYTYADTENDTESGSTYKWYRSDDGSGANKAAISGATSNTYTLVTADAGKYISFEVTPNDGTIAGTAVESSLQEVLNSAPTATSVSFTGTVKVGEELTGSYTYADVDNDTESGSTFKWYRSDNNSGTNKAAISSATATTYTLVTADVGKFISFEVTPSDGTQIGVAVESSLQILPTDKNALNFDGVDDRITVADNALFDFTSGFTAEAWVKSGMAATQTVLSQFHSAERSFHIILGTDGKIEFSISTTGTNDVYFISTNAVTANQWTHISCTYDGTTMRTYINGVANGTKAVTSPIFNSNNPIEIGARAGALPFTGSIDEVKVWNRALSATEITNQNNCKMNPNKTGLLFYFDFNQGLTEQDNTAITSVTDRTTNALNGTFIGFAKTGSTSNFSIGAQIGGTFSETSCANTAPTATSVTFTGTLTVGQELTGAYTYADADNDIESGSIYKWYRSDDGSGTNKAAISGATATTYTLVTADSGKFISFEVTPNDGTIAGTAVESSLQAVVNDTPTVTGGGIPNQTKDEDFASFGLDLKPYFADLETADTGLLFTVSGDNLVNVSITNGIATITSNSNLFGNESITIRATDPEGLFIEDIFSFTVNSINDAPTISAIQNKTILEDASEQTVGLTGISAGPTNENQSLVISATSDNLLLIPNPTITFTSGNSTGTLRYTPTANANGTATITVKVTDSDNKQTARAFVVTVNSVNDAPTATNVSFTGTLKISEQLTGSYTYADVEMNTESGTTYKWYQSDDNSSTNKAAISGATATTYTLVAADAGKYISFEVTPNDGTDAGTAVESTLQGPIDKKTPTITFASFSKTYGATDFNLGATSNATGTIGYSIVSGGTGSATLSGTNNKTVTLGNVGTVTLRATQASDANYNAATKDIILTITAKALTITADAKSKTYGQTDPTLTYQLTSGTLESGDSFSGNLTRAAGETVNTYTITQGTVTAGSNYTITYVNADLTINAKAITITADAKSKTYGQTDPTLTYQLTSGTLETGDAITGALTRALGESVNTYTITQGTVTAGSNYTITYVSADLTINAKALTITADAKSKTYGQTDPTLTYQLTSGTLETGDSFSGSLTRNAGETVNTYTITQGMVTAGSNYTITYVSADLTITAKALTITADAKSKTYGQTDPTLTYQLTSGTLETGDSFSGSLTRNAGETVNTYTITQGTVTAGSNYTITYVSANLTITAAAVVATTQAATSVTTTGAVLNGTINEGGAIATTFFEWGLASDLAGATTTAALPTSVTAGAGTTSVSLTLTNLTDNTLYYYRIKSTNSIGTSNGTIMNFTTLDGTPPSILSTVPADDGTGVTSSNLQIVFNEDVQKGTGDILIKRTSDNQVVGTIPVNGSEVTIDNTSPKGTAIEGTVTIHISPNLTLPSNTDLYIEIPSTAFEDLSGNAFPGFSLNTSWNFSTDTVLGLDTNFIKGFALYPNPTTDILNITAQEQIKQIEVFNLMGQQVKQKRVNSNSATVDLRSLPQGTYFVKVTTNKASKSVKLIKY